MPAIKATNSNNLTVENCDFIGFDTDIELENVDGFISKNNKFSQENDPRALLIKLSQEINNSGLDKSSKERLGKEIIEALEGGSTFDIQTFGVFCEPVIRKNIVCTHFSTCGLRPVWRKTKELLDHFYGSVTLEMIAKEETEVKHLVIAG